MSHVKLQVRPRRIRGVASCDPPPFRFAAAPAARGRAGERSRARVALTLPARAVTVALKLTAGIVDALFFLAGLTVWCALHLVLWSYAFDIGPAAACFGLPCPEWIASRVLLACGALALVTFVIAQLLRRLSHSATAAVLYLLVTLDVAALLLLGGQAIA